MNNKSFKGGVRSFLRTAFDNIYPTPRWVVYSIDLFLSAIAVFLAFLLRFSFEIQQQYIELLPFAVIYIVFVRACIFLLTSSYAGVVRMTGLRDMENNLRVVLLGSAVLIAANSLSYLLYSSVVIPTSVLVIEFIALSLMMNAYRLIISSVYYDLVNPEKEKSDVIIYGSDEHAFITKRAIESDCSLKMKAAAFIDNGNSNAGCQIDGVPIFDLQYLKKLFKEFDIEAVIIPSLTTSYHVKEYLMDQCLVHSIRVLLIPDVHLWIGGKLSYDPIDNLDVEDLLERDPIQLDMRKIRNEMTGRTILVTGAAGSIGSEIVRQLVRFRPGKIVLFDQDESSLYSLELSLTEDFRFYSFEAAMGSISDDFRVEKLFRTYKPEIVFHAAAYKHVPMMEVNPYEAVRVNVAGTSYLADMAVKYGARKFVMISTDKAVKPTNVMGATKRIAEMYVQSANQLGKTIFITTRFGNVLGSNGSVIPAFQKQLREKDELTVTHPEITRFFMSISEACQLVLEAGAMGKTGEIFIFDMGKPVKIKDLANRLVSLYGKTPGSEVKIRYTGLRPGEKLYEELLYDRETTLPTHNPKIMIAKTENCKYHDISEKVSYLLSIMKPSMTKEMVAFMKELVPGYISLNSRFGEPNQETFSVHLMPSRHM